MKKDIKESPLFWPAKMKRNVLLVLDETLIPAQVKYIKVTDMHSAVEVIRQMKTRAFGQLLVVLNTFLLEINKSPGLSGKHLLHRLEKTALALNRSRPTFPFAEVTGIVLRWAKQAFAEDADIGIFVRKNIMGYLAGIRAKRLERITKIAQVIRDGDTILTHCNVSGELAMAADICRRQKKRIYFFATETRPYLQGAKLTYWELKRMGADVTLVADNAVGSLMSDGLIDKIIVGSDRSCANGDFANKIGTYQIAVLAKEFRVPFYVLTQPSDKVKSGKDIPIEIRDSKELLTFGGKRIVRGRVKGFYPGFDVVPAKFITKQIAIDVR
ncbi:MAG: S-methyl-5-thioribose-1-phosphate isomerase [Candidatus Omnitrophota bacterium]